MKHFLKTIKHNPAYRTLWNILSPPFSLLAHCKLTLIEKTSDIKITGLEELDIGNSYIFTNWHEHLPYLCHHHGRQGRIYMMMSPAPYMAPIAMWCRLSGLGVVQNSSSDAALTTLAEHLTTSSHLEQEQGPLSVMLAVDGPAGPRREPKRGCIQLAQETGTPIVHVAYSCTRGTRDMSRWDQWLWPGVGDCIHVRYSQPMLVPPGESLEVSKRRVRALADSVTED